MNLQDYLDDVEQTELHATRSRDIRSIVERAKEQGLLQNPGEATALKVAARRRFGVPIDKTGGEAAAELAGMKSRWMDVTPAMAELWLKNNFNNRKVKPDVVKAYAREMKKGKWLPVHQGIAFNDHDDLVDGQHRLLAIVESGCTVRLLVTFGMPSAVKGTRMTGMDVVDRGATRSVADQLKVQHGIKGGSVLAMIVNRIVGICSPERTRRLSVGEVLDVHDLLQEEIDWVIDHKPKAHGLKQAGVLAAFAFALPLGERVREMFLQVTTGTKLEEGSALVLLRTFLTSDQAILLTRGNDRALAELVLQALWLEFTGAKVAELTISTEGADYFRDLQKDLVQKVASLFELGEGPGQSSSMPATGTSSMTKHAAA